MSAPVENKISGRAPTTLTVLPLGIRIDSPAINRALEPTVVLAPLKHGLRELAERCGIPAKAGGETERNA